MLRLVMPLSLANRVDHIRLDFDQSKLYFILDQTSTELLTHYRINSLSVNE